MNKREAQITRIVLDFIWEKMGVEEIEGKAYFKIVIKDSQLILDEQQAHDLAGAMLEIGFIQ